MAERELTIIGIEIEDRILATSAPHHRARVRFRYDLCGDAQRLNADCLCHSMLNPDSDPALVSRDLVENGLTQLRRMPEVWHDRATIRMALRPDRIVERSGQIPG